MKKRILALALAGTTAFSVFGAAMSANAANWWDGDSTHVVANDDAYYKHYDPAGDITWSTSYTAADKGNAGLAFYATSDKMLDDGNVLKPGSTIYTPYSLSGFKGYVNKDDKNAYTVVDIKEMDGYYATLNDFMKDHGYTVTTFTNGEFTVGSTTYVVASYNGSASDYINTEYAVFVKGNVDSNYTALTNSTAWDIYYQNLGNGVKVWVPTTGGSNATIDDLNKDVATVLKNTEEPYYIAKCSNLADVTNLTRYESTTQVYTSAEISTKGVYTDEGYTKLDATDPTSFDEVMNTPVESSGVVYLYDYYENLPASIDMDDFADAWGDESVANLMKEATDKTYGVINPYTGYRGRGVRQDVMYEWEDFLDELGISDASNKELTLWAENLYKNYVYTYHDENVVVSVKDNGDGTWTIKVTDGKDVDLYNFHELLEDIMEYAPADESENAQTSELVYLMQQYNKYTSEGFVDVKPVETSDWGDLLVSLAQAPTEDEFRTANAYKRYTNKVEDLVEQYEEAETSYAVTLAEQNLYDFVTSYNSAYTYSEKVDTDALATAIDNTYFNYDWRGDAKGYFGGRDTSGVLETTGKDANIASKDLVTKEYGNAWTLYPAGDYSGNAGALYAGVDATAIKGVTSEYEWFYNVYALAYDVYTSNKYQGTVDLMASTLNEAVEALAPSYAARASDVLGAEEANDKLENLVETDYTSTMWSNRNKINTYINDRVSNDEIGRIATQNSETIAEKTADLLGDQMFQTVVTRSEINDVKTAQSNAKAALKALQDDEDKYNAAQANALEKAIDDCQYIIDIYNGDYSKSAKSQSVNNEYSAAVGDKDQILKSDCTNAVQAVDDAIDFKNVIMGWYDSTGDGDWMYGVADTYDSDLTWGTEDPLSGPHYLNFGWAKIGNTWFYFDEEGIALKSDWLQVGNDWYYFNSNCGASIGWARVDDKWYYFNGGCRMMTGWVKVDGNYYYLSSSGAMVTGWCQVGGKWYYLSQASNSLGQMLYSTTTPDGYQVGADGALVE